MPQKEHQQQHAKDGQLLQQQQQQQRLLQLQQLQRELQEKRQQRGQAQPQLNRQQPVQQHPRQQQQQQQLRPSPPPLPRQQLQEQRLPVSYPSSRTERLQQLAQPKAAQRQKYEQVGECVSRRSASVLAPDSLRVGVEIEGMGPSREAPKREGWVRGERHYACRQQVDCKVLTSSVQEVPVQCEWIIELKCWSEDAKEGWGCS